MPALAGTCGPACWTGIALVAGTLFIVSPCTNDGPQDQPKATPERYERCRQAWLICLNDKSIPEGQCFDAFNNCIKHNETVIFPGRGNRGNPVN